ncbi:hypothetical protein PENSPDRAFT_652679 [Peniophora sp. CONT]|nr:hypothetical protein PENSPDRAFT_652679 [Peniophora sp. CONT]
MADPWLQLSRARIFACPTGTTRREHMQYLDKEIQSLESILANAKETRNLQHLLVSFPEEILVEILKLVRDAPPPSVAQGALHNCYNGPWSDQRRRSCWQCGEYRLWTSTGGVCRRLRTVVSCSLLHARAWDCALPAVLLQHSLERSASIPLNLDLNSAALGSDLDAMNVLKYVKLHRSRVHALSLQGARGRNVLALHFLQRLNLFTNLKSLRLCPYTRKELVHHALAQRFLVPLNGLGHPVEAWQPPSTIETLHLSVIPFPWASTIYNGLTELTLAKLYSSNRNAPTLTVINDLFRRMTRLESLTFDRVDVDVDPIVLTDEELDAVDEARQQEILLTEKTVAFLDEQWQVGNFALPISLKTWTVVFNPMSIVPFLMRPSTSVKYILKSLSPPHESDGTIKRFLSIHFPPAQQDGDTSGVRAPIVAIDFSIEDGPTSLQARASYFRGTTSGSDTVPDVTLHFSTEDDFSPSDCFFLLLDSYDREDVKQWLARPDYNHVSNLTIDCVAAKYTVADWRKYLHYLPSLQTIRLPQDMLAAVVLAMGLRDTPAPCSESLERSSAEDSHVQVNTASLRFGDAPLDLSLDVLDEDDPEHIHAKNAEVLPLESYTMEYDDPDFPVEVFSEEHVYDYCEPPNPEAAMSIKAIHIKPSEEYGYASSGYAVHVLLDWLEQRKEKGCSLRTLRVPPALAEQLAECYADEEGVGEWVALLAVDA